MLNIKALRKWATADDAPTGLIAFDGGGGPHAELKQDERKRRARARQAAMEKFDAALRRVLGGADGARPMTPLDRPPLALIKLARAAVKPPIALVSTEQVQHHQ